MVAAATQNLPRGDWTLPWTTSLNIAEADTYHFNIRKTPQDGFLDGVSLWSVASSTTVNDFNSESHGG